MRVGTWSLMRVGTSSNIDERWKNWVTLGIMALMKEGTIILESFETLMRVGMY